MTKVQFKAKAVAAFKRANPEASNARITWLFVGPLVPYPSGTGRGRQLHGKFRCGHFSVEAPGFRTLIMFADGANDGSYISVR